MSHKLRHVVRWACLVSAIGATGIGVLSGCSDDDDVGGGGTADAGNDARSDTGTQPGTDSGNPGTDSGQKTDSGNDSGNEPTVTVTTGPSGLITVYNFLVAADFHEDDTIVHVSDAPDCVAHVFGATKPYSNAGDLTVTSDTVGQPGGPTVPLVVAMDPNALNTYAGEPDTGLFFPIPGNGEAVQVQLAGTDTMPAMAPVTVHSPVLEAVARTGPMLVDAGGDESFGNVKSTDPLVFNWTVADAGPAAGQRVVFHALGFGSKKFAMSLDCSWPASAGTGTVPASMLSYLRQKAGPTDPLSGYASLEYGDMKEVTVGGASYVVIVSQSPATTPAFGLK